MGVLNATPDSFSGDGLLADLDALVDRGLAAVRDGAAILDVGGESTRPGAEPVSADDETARVLPVIRALVTQVDVPLSIDTMKPEVAEAALEAGARIVNDVSGLRDPGLAEVAARQGAWLVLTHNRWTVRARHDALGGYYAPKRAADVVREVADCLLDLARTAVERGVPKERLILDPGLGFGKSPDESLTLLGHTGDLRDMLAPYPLLVGPSRKSFVGRALDLPVDDRLEGTLACVAIAAYLGAEIIRAHDVAPSMRAARMAWAVRQEHI